MEKSLDRISPGRYGDTMINELFKMTRSTWVRYSEYVWKETPEGRLYLTAADDAMPKITDPMKDFDHIVVDAVNIGRLCMREYRDVHAEDEIREAIHTFASNYGLLGLMTGLTTTPEFLDYEYVYFHHNRVLNEESMAKEDYLRIFFPFKEPDLSMSEDGTLWAINGDNTMKALAMTMSDRSIASNLTFQREYAEPLDWMKKQFTDWAFLLVCSFLYYEDYDLMDENRRDFTRQSISAFSSVAPLYHMELHEHPVVVWEFNSLMVGIQMMFSFMMANEEHPMKMCRTCGKAFIAKAPGDEFCSDKCRREHEEYLRGQRDGED